MKDLGLEGWIDVPQLDSSLGYIEVRMDDRTLVIPEKGNITRVVMKSGFYFCTTDSAEDMMMGIAGV